MSNKIVLSFKSKKKEQKPSLDKSNVFQEDEEDSKDVKKQVAQQRTKISRMDQQLIESAVKEDPSIFEYDSVFQSTSDDKKSKSKVRPTREPPRYIHNLLKACEERQVEQERRVERKIQKERQMEGDEYSDKEIFVTNTYKQKLLEIEEQERLLKLDEQRDALLDVRTHGNLNGFYRYMYKNGMFSSEKPADEADESMPIINRRKKAERNYRKVESASSDEYSSDTNQVEEESEEEIVEDNNQQENEEEEEKPQVEKVEELLPKETKPKVVINKDEILRKIERRIDEIILGFRKKTVDSEFDQAVKEYLARQQKRHDRNWICGNLVAEDEH